MRLDTIQLRDALPCVFRGAEMEPPVNGSQIWLHDVTFTRGGVYMIEAESGTGKSSLCSYIYGNRHDYTGSILFNGMDIRNFSVEEWCDLRCRHIALLPQEMRLFPELTAMENIEIKNRLTGCKSREEILAMLDRLEIAGKADVPASRLSIGQQQRVAIVRALCQPFDFLLLDEPVSHLDARNNAVVASIVAEEAASRDAGVIATSVGYAIALEVTRKYSL
ncbi:MAG: ATP-binding cassette domain-containing protein [Candidatus Homeothermus sp.]|nr:ATP-binding cassette domain-containing protein [Candidatus Homeothermus sp.]